MHPIQGRLFICASHERADYARRDISHVIIVGSPGAIPPKPHWFRGAFLQLQFGDVVSEADAKRCKTAAPRIEDIQRAMEFVREAWKPKDAKLLVSCDQGASRSPALAYLFVADQFGPGHEAEAFDVMMAIQPIAVPNSMVVRLGDTFLKREGALLAPLKELYARISAELFPKRD